MKKRKLKYHFHNPNKAEETAELLYKIFIDVNANKAERAIKEDAEQTSQNAST